jgi:hypothetical protein
MSSVIDVAVAFAPEGDLSGALLVLVNTLGDEIKDLSDVAGILRYVPKFVSAVHTLAVPGSEKKALVLKGLHALTAVLVEKKVLTDTKQAEFDAFIDTVVPVSIESTMDVVKGTVTFAAIEHTLAANKNAVGSVIATSLNCCGGFFSRWAKKAVQKSIVDVESVIETVKETAKEVVEEVVEKVVEEAKEVVEDIIEKVVEEAKEVVEDIVEKVVEEAKEAKEVVEDVVEKALASIAEEPEKIEAV